MLSKLKVTWDSSFIYTHWALSSRKLFRKLPTYMWPMFIHVWPMSIHVGTNNMNYELIKSELKVN